MDNKVTKKRINDHLEYDWFKYVILIIASIVLWIFVFDRINVNRDHEEALFFITCYSSKETLLQNKIINRMDTEMDVNLYGKPVLRDFNFECQNPLSTEYGNLFSTHGAFSSDALIIAESTIKEIGRSYVPLSDELLRLVLPNKMQKDVSDGGYQEEYYALDGVNYGIRVDNLPSIKDFLNFVPPELEEKPKDDATDDRDTKFYLVLNRNSVNIGRWGSNKTKNNNSQVLYAVNVFLAEFI